MARLSQWIVLVLVVVQAQQLVEGKRYIIKVKPEAIGAPSVDEMFNSAYLQFSTLVTEQSTKPVIHSRINLANTLNFVVCEFEPSFAQRMQKHDAVEYIEEDLPVKATGPIPTKRQSNGPLGTQASAPSWGLIRISERRPDDTQPFRYPSNAGSGVTVYVVDTGIDASNVDFGGRASNVFNSVDGETDTDLAGHGTHVSGTIGGNTYGVAKKVTLKGVKVLDQNGNGQVSNVLAGLEYVLANNVPGKTVINMSISGQFTQSLDDALTQAASQGVAIVVAAGNTGGNACLNSPGSNSHVLTVGATDQQDNVATFSALGKCVDIFGPGVRIMSDWITSNSAINILDGTSMAAPHVTGIAALALGQQPMSPPALFAHITSAATTGAIKFNPNNPLSSETPNKLAYDMV
ncbi:hypothetical protein BZG36_02448 [Bifiguratus adelaidae]|uniref:Peptidase S8/S53 domain-containing protein n=1 Tax=Bifiguratus adelaidae TaxID=1938954 RepID=A0A261Y3P0_9FUNG|nr:hypothetical protein BZG36_02448 [Bifiguratus adelaidae]